MTQISLSQWMSDPGVSRRTATVFGMVAQCAMDITRALRAAAVAGDGAAAQAVNVQGEVQKKLDVVANEIFLRRVVACGVLAAMVSEELDDIELVRDCSPNATLALVFDPLDGSSNLEINGAVGSIFSLIDLGKSRNISAQDVFRPGSEQVAAGYVLYGPATIMVLTDGLSVAVFSLDEQNATFLLVKDNVRIAPDAGEFAINASRDKAWFEPTRDFIAACLAGEAGPYEKAYNMRWCAAMVADLHRIVCRGGIFLYPEDEGTKDKGGRLRLLYEANPMSLIVEAAGGLATNGTDRILDIVPSSLHQRVGVIIGSRNEVERARSLYRQPQYG